MLRSIVGVIVGFAVIFVFFFAIFTGAYLALGVERIFQPDSYEVPLFGLCSLPPLVFAARFWVATSALRLAKASEHARCSQGSS
jgi:hypothetical protein